MSGATDGQPKGKIPRHILLFNFRLAQLRLEAAKRDEMRWRVLVAFECFADVSIGTNTSSDGLVKLIAKENISLDKDKEKVRLVINKLQNKCGATDNLAGLFDWDWKFSETVYRQLSDNAKTILAEILTIKAATPTVSLVEK